MDLIKKLLDYIKLRLNILDRIELKLRRMKKIAVILSEDNVKEEKRKELEAEFNRLNDEVNDLDEKSKAEKFLKDDMEKEK